MNLRFADPGLRQLWLDEHARSKLPEGVVNSFRGRCNGSRPRTMNGTFAARRSWHFERLQGRIVEHSIRLNDQYRLILTFEGAGPEKTVVIVAIEDYH
jgi:plasmid maintenance system killer protein